MMTGSVAEGRAMNTDFFFLDLDEDFYLLCHSILVGKREIPTERTVRYVENCLDCQTQRAVGSVRKFRGWPAPSDFSQLLQLTVWCLV